MFSGWSRTISEKLARSALPLLIIAWTNQMAAGVLIMHTSVWGNLSTCRSTSLQTHGEYHRRKGFAQDCIQQDIKGEDLRRVCVRGAGFFCRGGAVGELQGLGSVRHRNIQAKDRYLGESCAQQNNGEKQLRICCNRFHTNTFYWLTVQCETNENNLSGWPRSCQCYFGSSSSVPTQRTVDWAPVNNSQW